jgi:hypothetical protein
MKPTEKYKFLPGMGEISGFGGAYEQQCRNMVIAGCNWFDEHPGADPKITTYQNIFGIIDPNNEDAKSLTGTMAEICPDCTGAMMQAAVTHVLFIKRKGWDEYVKQMSKPERQ